MMATQKVIAEHLDMTTRNLREVLNKLGMLSTKNSLDEIRVAYIRHLREQAAGRGGEDQASLTRARTREAQASAHLKELQIAEKAKTLIPADEVEPGFAALITAARTELLTLPDKLAMEIKTLHDVDIDPAMIQDHIYEALQHLANGTSGAKSVSK